MSEQKRPLGAKKSGDRGRAFVLALIMHALLFGALFFAFQWKTQNEEVFAELWAEVPSSGTKENGAPVKPAPEEKEEPSPAPAPKPESEPAKPEADIRAEQARAAAAAAEAQRRADIALAAEKEKKAKEEAKKKAEAEKARQKAEEKKKADEEKRRAAAQAAAEKVKAAEAARQTEAARRAAMANVRNAELARVAGGKPSDTAAGVPAGDRTAQFQNLSGSAKASFIARVTACIRPNIIFTVPGGVKRSQYQAVYRVRLMPTGEQIGVPRKTKASGLAGYDEAVERAIARCPRFPSAPGVVMPGEVTLTFDPIDTK